MPTVRELSRGTVGRALTQQVNSLGIHVCISVLKLSFPGINRLYHVKFRIVLCQRPWRLRRTV